MTYYATQLRANLYAIRPSGCLGTCGWREGRYWQVRYVTARNAAEALTKAERAEAASRATSQ